MRWRKKSGTLPSNCLGKPQVVIGSTKHNFIRRERVFHDYNPQYGHDKNVKGSVLSNENHHVQVRITTGTLLDGSKVAWHTGVRKSIIEMDSLTILNWVQGVKEVICVRNFNF